MPFILMPSVRCMANNLRFVLSGCPASGIVLDTLDGSRTVAVSAILNDKRYCLIEINPEYVSLINERVLEARDSDTMTKKR